MSKMISKITTSFKSRDHKTLMSIDDTIGPEKTREALIVLFGEGRMSVIDKVMPPDSKIELELSFCDASDFEPVELDDE